MRKYVCILIALSALCACRPRSNAPIPVMYCPPSAPSVISTQEQLDGFYARNFWQDFDFSDTTQLALCDSAAFVGLYVQYVSVLERVPDIGPSCMRGLMEKASGSKVAFERFVMGARLVLADPNSPMRDDELYMPVLESMIANDTTDIAALERNRYRLDILMQNRIGHKANDIVYTLANGRTDHLYGIDAQYTLVFINNPGCDMCRYIRQCLCASQMLTSMIADGTLKVLAIYPDKDLDEWYHYMDEMPSNWINGYDNDCRMRSEGTYNLNAIPALYLLDKDKTVLVKDGTDVSQLENAILL